MKKNKFLILGIVFFALAGVMLVGMAAESMRNAEHYSIAYSLLPAVLFAALGAWMMAKIKMPPKKKAEQAGKRRRRKTYRGLKVVGGLPVPEGASCIASFDGITLVIAAGGAQYHLDASKLRSIELSKDIDRRVYSEGSLTGGLIGGALFGLAGAVIGSAPRKRIETQVLRGAVIGYEDIDVAAGLAYIVLSDRKTNAACSRKLVKRLKPYVKTKHAVYHL